MKYFFTIAALLYSISCFSQLRNMNWGTPKDVVKRIESAKLLNDYNGDLTYHLNVSDLNCQLQYFFSKTGLVEVRYTFTPLVIDRTRFNQTATWDKTCFNLTEKYGMPTSGAGAKFRTWDLKDFSIKATLDNSRMGEIVVVSYSPPAASQKDIL